MNLSHQANERICSVIFSATRREECELKIHLGSNFKLLGSQDIESIDLDAAEITVKAFLQTMSDRSTKTPEYVNGDGTGLEGGWQVQVNGRMLDFCENGINTVLKDGDTVATV